MGELIKATRPQMVLLKKEGSTEREIAAQLLISKTAVRVTIVGYRKPGMIRRFHTVGESIKDNFPD